MMLDAGALSVQAMPSSSLPPLPGELQESLGIAPELVSAVTGAREFVVIRALSVPGWPPMHEWAGRACAAVLAAHVGVPLVDTGTPGGLATDAALRSLPGDGGRFRLADWMLVFQSAGSGGLWTTTLGLGRFGLPQVQVRNVPPQLGKAWARGPAGLASRPLRTRRNPLRDRAQPAFDHLPPLVDVLHARFARAH